MAAIDRLLQIMARLRDPQRGCPWDLEQTFATIAPYTIEEAYEVADAIQREDSAAPRPERGTRSKRPAKSPTRSSVRTPQRCAMSSAICCSRSCFTREWRRSRAR